MKITNEIWIDRADIRKVEKLPPREMLITFKDKSIEELVFSSERQRNKVFARMIKNLEDNKKIHQKELTFDELILLKENIESTLFRAVSVGEIKITNPKTRGST